MTDKGSVTYGNGTTVGEKEKSSLLVVDIARDIKKQVVDHGSAFTQRVKENKAKYAAKAGLVLAGTAAGAFLLTRRGEEPEATDQYYTYDEAGDEAPFEPDTSSVTEESES